MKAKVTRLDGTVLELEGTAEEIARVVDWQPLAPKQWLNPAISVPSVFGPLPTCAHESDNSTFPRCTKCGAHIGFVFTVTQTVS